MGLHASLYQPWQSFYTEAQSIYIYYSSHIHMAGMRAVISYTLTYMNIKL